MRIKTLCAVVALATLVPPLWADLVAYPEYPSQIQRDYAYAVRVTQGEKKVAVPVYNHTEQSVLTSRTRGGDVNRRFCEFAFSGEPVRVDVRVTEDVRCYKVFPARRALKSSFHEGVISIWVEKPCQFGLQLNDYDKTILSIFADAPEDPATIPQKGAAGVYYVDGWVDATAEDGVIETGPEIKEVYLAPGSVLNARLRVKARGAYVHGRGMVLDPMSDVFRFDQSKNAKRGLVALNNKGITVEDIKLIDARTFNFMGWASDLTYRNVKVLASMMCSDGITSGGANLLVEDSWLYVGDNALVVSGVKGGVYRNVALGTSCAAIFPQGTNRDILMENIDVFRADDGLINNWHNGALRRNNKWSEMNTGLQKKEPDPQDYAPQSNAFFFRHLSAVDCTLFSKFFSGRNMGKLPKTFGFEDVSIPFATGRSDWRLIGKTDGVAVEVNNNPKKWLISDNYHLAITNLWLGGQSVAAFPEGSVKGVTEGTLALDVVTNPRVPCAVPRAADRHEVNWTCPYKVFVGAALQRDWRRIDLAKGEQRFPAETTGNLLAEASVVKSVWQRYPSWLVKFEATQQEGDSRLYHLIQCERSAGIQNVITDAFLRRGNGTYKLSFTVKATSEKPLVLKMHLLSNEKWVERTFPLQTGGNWQTLTAEVKTDFDLSVTELVALQFSVNTPADDLVFKDFSFVKLH